LLASKSKDLKEEAEEEEEKLPQSTLIGFITWIAQNNFIQPRSKGKIEILTDRLSPKGHPTFEGLRVLEDEMVKYLDPILID
jgi:hypothetical protein